MSPRPHILFIIPRGESVRNFLYSDTLDVLTESADVTLLSVIYDDDFRARFEDKVRQIIPLQTYQEHWFVLAVRKAVKEAHFRWVWSKVAQNRWETWDLRKTRDPGNAYGRELNEGSEVNRSLRKLLFNLLANRPMLRLFTAIENQLAWMLRPTHFFDDLYNELQPDLVFNTSHIHGNASFLPTRVAHRMGIPTVGYVFSWDNLTSRSRILEPYDHYMVWTDIMKRDLLHQYGQVRAEDVTVVGTSQFDFHAGPEYMLDRAALAEQIGFDPSRPFILWTTGIDAHFPEEHRTVAAVIDWLADLPGRPQLVVRTYAKGTSEAMYALADANHPDVFFPPVQWDDVWYMPAYEDMSIYTSLLKECALGINAASTVSLELAYMDKPIINLAFDPPDTNLAHPYRWERHIEFDHYQPVVDSGATWIARDLNELRQGIEDGLMQPTAKQAERRALLESMFGDTLQQNVGQTTATHLLKLVNHHAG